MGLGGAFETRLRACIGGWRSRWRWQTQACQTLWLSYHGRRIVHCYKSQQCFARICVLLATCTSLPTTIHTRTTVGGHAEVMASTVTCMPPSRVVGNHAHAEISRRPPRLGLRRVSLKPSHRASSASPLATLMRMCVQTAVHACFPVTISNISEILSPLARD